VFSYTSKFASRASKTTPKIVVVAVVELISVVGVELKFDNAGEVSEKSDDVEVVDVGVGMIGLH
jgi:hypothetical protein